MCVPASRYGMWIQEACNHLYAVNGAPLTRFHIGYGPEVYFKPQEVWEIRGAE